VIDSTGPGVTEFDSAEPGPPDRRSRRWVAWLAALVVAVGAGAGAAVWQNTGTRAAATTAPSAAAPVVAALPRPAAKAPLSERQAWVNQEVKTTLAEQTAGLLAGDPARFSANALPAAAGELGRRFRTLRALQVTRFEQRIDGQPWLEKDGRWRVVHVVEHCLVEPECALDEAVFDSLWKETAEGLRFAAFRPHDRDAACSSCALATRMLARPWATTELAAQVGARTLVAVPLRYRNRLAELSRQAEKAAAVADRYAVGDGRVPRYRVFVADSTAWKQWYSGFPGRWVAGRAIPTGQEQIEVAVQAAEVTGRTADDLLRHELAHVSTLRTNAYYGKKDVWWLVEGMAEYVQQNGAAPSSYPARQALLAFLSRRTLRSVMVTPPDRDGSATEANARYAVGYYALDHLIAKYGKPAALKFFQQAVQFGIGLDGASIGAFGKPWAEVDRECAAAIRRL
jgi:hypothetical protein